MLACKETTQTHSVRRGLDVPETNTKTTQIHSVRRGLDVPETNMI